MSQEDKQFLLNDLCARLPYGVKLNFYAAATKENYTCTLLGIEPNDDKSIIAKVDSGAFMFPAEHIKPYLRPLSSMTEGECLELSKIKPIYDKVASWKYIKTPVPLYIANIDQFDFFNSHHLDWRGLIEKGLALEAPKDMYKI